ncbi:MAG TPA: HDOD domain-containing protein, partial [Syntrophorhabdaceae bacterium]|nr:HDOD domain-containing protein [Syntrophorhabdaceae bacterium]
MKFIIFLALIVIAIIALSIAFKKKEKPQDITKSKIRKDRGADMPQSERLSSTATSGDKSVEIKPHKIMSTKAIDPKTILGHIEYIEIGKNIYPAGVDQIDDDVRKNLESKVGLIPQIPSNSMRLMNLLLNPESNLKEIVSLVSIHPVFSAKILQTVNSVYFSLPQKITSIGRAITLLGYNNVRALVFHETLLNTMQKQEEYDAERYLKIWAHSAMVSACAGFMGKYIFGLSEYDLATSGLLHDIGKFYLTDIKDSIEIVSDVPPFIKEEHRFGVNHSVAGTYIANHWQLP